MYNHVFVAGTFDGIHKGHTVLLSEAFVRGGKVTVGLTSDAFIRKYKLNQSDQSDQFTNYKTRKRSLEEWLGEHGRQATVISIDDPLEPAASMGDLDAIIVTSQTAFRAREINELRKKRKLEELAILEVPMVDAEDRKPISSTRLRNGEIDREGRLIMPEFMREVLSKPLGRLLVGQNIDVSIHRYTRNIIITVGDVATKTLLDCGVTPALSIIDFRVGRKPSSILAPYKKSIVLHSTKVQSGPGFISKKAMQVVQARLEGMGNLTDESKVIIVEGEEDLLVLPAIQFAPFGSVVYYGQPRIASVRGKPHGLVEVVVTEEKKKEVIALLEHFT